MYIISSRAKCCEIILVINIPNSRGLVVGETKSLYVLANVFRFFSGECILRLMFYGVHAYTHSNKDPSRLRYNSHLACE